MTDETVRLKAGATSEGVTHEGRSNVGDGDAWFRACAVGLVLTTLAFFSTGTPRVAFDAALRSVFPGRVTLQVAPGNARVRAGSPLGISARLVGNPARIVAQVEMNDGHGWRTVDMRTDADGRFRFRLDPVTGSFKYRVLAGTVTSPTYSVSVADAIPDGAR